MIFDQLENILHYELLNKYFEQAIRFLNETDLNSLQAGRYDLLEDKVYASISEYETKEVEEVEWEAHKKYIDIQLLIEGEEKIGCTTLKHLQVTKEYISEKDIMFFKGEGEYFTLKTGSFAIFFPHDAHRPGLISDKKIKVKKLVFKVIYNDF